ncbi:MAG: GTP-binding protein [Bacteroidota bacterium]
MESIITIVGFLGAGKTTLLKRLVNHYLEKGWSPFVVLNDYENAYLDAQQFIEQMDAQCVRAFSGSCICCSGIHELRDAVNRIPTRTNGITLIEANGTSDACSLMGFLGVGIDDRFLPPIQISVVDVRNWQRRETHNELEANQIQVSSLIVLNYTESVSEERLHYVIKDLKRFNPTAQIIEMSQIEKTSITQLSPSENKAERFDHLKAHWASCSADLPALPSEEAIYAVCNAIPASILRIKGCTKIGEEESYTYFERTPSGEINIRPFRGIPTTGTKLLSIGPGSEVSVLEKAIQRGVNHSSESVA